MADISLVPRVSKMVQARNLSIEISAQFSNKVIEIVFYYTALFAVQQWISQVRTN
jgi:hypothetical protein